MKLHTVLDLRENIPCFMHISSGRMADVTSLDLVPIELESFYVMDRGYTEDRYLVVFWSVTGNRAGIVWTMIEAQTSEE